MEKLLEKKDVAFSGWRRLDDSAVRRAAYATSSALTKQFGPSARVVIGYSSNGLASIAAEQAALVFADRGQQVIWLHEAYPRPVISCAVQELEASAGIFITEEEASAGTIRYNLIGSDGQPQPDEWMRIVQEEMESLDSRLNVTTMPKIIAQQRGLLQTVGSEIAEHYVRSVVADLIQADLNKPQDLHILLCGLNETSRTLTKEVLKLAQFNVTEYTGRQEDAANPITNKVLLKEAVQQAKQIDAAIVILIADDGEQMDVAVKNDDGVFVRLSGQQAGALLLEYTLSNQKRTGTLPQDAILLKSITTSGLYRKIAAAYGVHTTNVLHTSKQMDGSSYTFLYSADEQGTLKCEHLLSSSDAIQMSLMLCEMAAFVEAQGKSIYSSLQDVYKKYGYYKESSISVQLGEGHDAENIQRMILDQFRFANFEKVGTKKLWRKSDFFPEANILKYDLDNDASIVFAPTNDGDELTIWFSVTGTNPQGCQFVITSMKHDIIHHLYEFEKYGQT